MTLQKLIGENNPLMVPCVCDAFVARAAKRAGFQAVLLSGGALSYSLNGVPDMAMLNLEELADACASTAACGMPVIVDADDGYGESSAVIFRNVKRLVLAGAKALTIDDTTGIRGYERYLACMDDPDQPEFVQPVVSREQYLSKICAAAKACEGSDCVVIARTDCASALGREEAMIRCRLSRKAGAFMTMNCDGMETTEDAKRAQEDDPGPKVWPDLVSTEGVTKVRPDEIAAYGFSMITFHVFEKAALYGMIHAGIAERGEDTHARQWIANATS